MWVQIEKARVLNFFLLNKHPKFTWNIPRLFSSVKKKTDFSEDRKCTFHYGSTLINVKKYGMLTEQFSMGCYGCIFKLPNPRIWEKFWQSTYFVSNHKKSSAWVLKIYSFIFCKSMLQMGSHNFLEKNTRDFCCVTLKKILPFFLRKTNIIIF